MMKSRYGQVSKQKTKWLLGQRFSISISFIYLFISFFLSFPLANVSTLACACNANELLCFMLICLWSMLRLWFRTETTTTTNERKSKHDWTLSRSYFLSYISFVSFLFLSVSAFCFYFFSVCKPWSIKMYLVMKPQPQP